MDKWTEKPEGENMNKELKTQFAFQIEIMSAIYEALAMCQAYHYVSNEIV